MENLAKIKMQNSFKTTNNFINKKANSVQNYKANANLRNMQKSGRKVKEEACEQNEQEDFGTYEDYAENCQEDCVEFEVREETMKADLLSLAFDDLVLGNQ